MENREDIDSHKREFGNWRQGIYLSNKRRAKPSAQRRERRVHVGGDMVGLNK